MYIVIYRTRTPEKASYQHWIIITATVEKSLWTRVGKLKYIYVYIFSFSFSSSSFYYGYKIQKLQHPLCLRKQFFNTEHPLGSSVIPSILERKHVKRTTMHLYRHSRSHLAHGKCSSWQDTYASLFVCFVFPHSIRDSQLLAYA